MADDTIKRRQVLRGLGATAAAAGLIGSGMSGAANDSGGDGSSPDIKYDARTKRRFSRGDVARVALDSHGGAVLEELSERDIIAEPSTAEFAFDHYPDASLLKPGDDIEGRTITRFRNQNDEWELLLTYSVSTPDHDIAVHVQPGADRSYAKVQPTSTDEEYIVDPEVEDGVIRTRDDSVESLKAASAESCPDSTSCTDDVCNQVRYYLWHTKLKFDCRSGAFRCRCYVADEECACREGDPWP